MRIIQKEKNDINGVNIIEAKFFWCSFESISQFLDHNVNTKQIPKLISII